MVTGKAPPNIDYNTISWAAGLYFEAHLFSLSLTDLFLSTGKMSCRDLHEKQITLEQGTEQHMGS